MRILRIPTSRALGGHLEKRKLLTFFKNSHPEAIFNNMWYIMIYHDIYIYMYDTLKELRLGRPGRTSGLACTCSESFGLSAQHRLHPTASVAAVNPTDLCIAGESGRSCQRQELSFLAVDSTRTHMIFDRYWCILMVIVTYDDVYDVYDVIWCIWCNMMHMVYCWYVLPQSFFFASYVEWHSGDSLMKPFPPKYGQFLPS